MSKSNSNTAVQTPRKRGRPASFPGQQCSMAGFNLPDAVLARLKAGADKREITQNALVARALEAYLRKD